MSTSAPDLESQRTKTVQRIVKIRRDYNTWVANETIEDYALRFTPRAFRKWSIFRVANTAFGAIAFLVLEAIGGTLAVHYGFINAFWAILAVSLIIFLTGLPISYYAARHGVDMDLLTRGAGFGYIGSTISSFIYASFTFILFALEAAIMAYALELYFGMPLWLGYLASALVVVPLVTHGVTLISRIQMVSQPLWLLLMALPFIAIAFKRPDLPGQLLQFAGADPANAHFNTLAFGAATAVGVALIPQIGEQVDFLRFMPPPGKQRLRWHIGVLAAGPGWTVVGALKMLAGALLALLALQGGADLAQAVNPTHMYLAGFNLVGAGPGLALLATVVFVVVSQVKINMTNAYAGSLAWSNFFARLTHSHPGRVVWACFNALIAVLLMELNVFQALDQVLGLFSNIALAWIAAVVADLVINKPLGLSPAGIEFRRAYLYDINPVGVGAMLLASLFSVAAFTGMFGATAQAYSAFIALVTAFAAAPAIAYLTGGRYYIARPAVAAHSNTCSICEKAYEAEDMAHCPAYQGPICSLCCCLDARCDDACKPHARLSVQWQAAMRWLLPRSAWPYLVSGLSYYMLLMILTLLFLGSLLGLLYLHEAAALMQAGAAQLLAPLRLAFLKIFGALLLVSAIVAWWLVLNREGRRVAQEEAQQARKLADQANQAKSRYIAGISHEIRTPLNSILGYAQLLENDPAMPPHRQLAIRVIRGSGEHLLSLIEGTLDIERIEGGRLSVDLRPLEFTTFIAQLVHMFEQQAASKGLTFRYEGQGSLPAVVRADRKRLGQILINILGNAVKFTSKGSIAFRLRYQRDMAHFEVEDSGPGILEHELEHIFEPFARGSAGDAANCGGTGLGLPISKLLTELMGGELTVRSTPGAGSVFSMRLLLPRLHAEAPKPDAAPVQRSGYAGVRRRILVVDNDRNDRELLAEILTPLGFIVGQAASGHECLQCHAGFDPDLILMDLAMPGMDGWEASHLLRTEHGCTVPIGIVSANAYDKGLPNPAGIGADDFFTKPVQLAELLDWIGRQLQLDWIAPEAAPVSAATAPPTGPLQLPPAAQLAPLRAQVKAGYMRGIKQQLDAIAALGEPYLHFVDIMRAHAQRFELEAMARLLEQGASHATND